MQKQVVDEEKTSADFEQCPVCESYQIAEEPSQFCCNRCGLVWVAVRRFEE